MMAQIEISWVAAGLMALSAGTAASTPRADLPPPSVRDKGMKSVPLVRQLTVPALQSIPGSVSCTIRYTDKYFGHLSDRQYSLKYKMRLQSTCYDVRAVKWLGEFPVGLDSGTENWVPDIEGRLNWAASAGGQEGVDPTYRKLRRDALRAYTLKSVNAQGFAFTEKRSSATRSTVSAISTPACSTPRWPCVAEEMSAMSLTDRRAI